MTTQAEKGRAFRALHERTSAFIIPNPWDVGTARLLAHLGFEALATTSAGHAFAAGKRDTSIDRPEAIAARSLNSLPRVSRSLAERAVDYASNGVLRAEDAEDNTSNGVAVLPPTADIRTPASRLSYLLVDPPRAMEQPW